MPISTIHHSTLKKPRNKPNSTNNTNESKFFFSTKPKNKKKFMSVSFGGLGCKGKLNSPPVSAPAVIRSAAQWESTNQMRKNTRRKKTTLSSTSTRNIANVVVDIPDVCCAPPGIGSASDVAPRPRTPSQRSNNREHSRVARRTANGEEISRFRASNIRHQCPRSHHRPSIMILRQNLQFARDLDGDDQHGSWRLDVDDMSYEQLVELSDRIGYVGTGLAEEKIVQYIRKFKLSTVDSSPLLISTDKAWKCTICQEGYKVDDEIGRLECGHYHHIECIKKWLMQKNTCPVCKSAAV
ncbi:PREDICTED: E3 ubiquitin-protein ligase MBR2-like [Nicotiana attenuata]|uniref:RING-type E3 ubiquitin transferase n=1 Tax=Nicotiana attenuata TaxID=49451 RepID=A0A1J6HY65_NICAT|nr:PREDICTED: E3 ubiquitin-protein ligase MBR2-like [Nicotiana attenuata]OIS97281.1 putative e3 ubiquitin-protein ligase hip1 [Nicotiana attenuata]